MLKTIGIERRAIFLANENALFFTLKKSGLTVPTKGYRLQHATVTVCEDLNGIITILRQGKALEYRRHDRAKKNADIVDAKELDAKLDAIKHTAKKYIPPASHPWRHYIINPINTEIHAQKSNIKMD
jgi:hypothetical protein